MTAEAEYLINFSEQEKKFCLSLHYNGVNIYHFKAKYSKWNVNLLFWGCISKDFPNDNMKETGLNEYVYNFWADYGSICVDDILNIHKYLMEKHNIKQYLD